jgi:hypothetical protein
MKKYDALLDDLLATSVPRVVDNDSVDVLWPDCSEYLHVRTFGDYLFPEVCRTGRAIDELAKLTYEATYPFG